MIYFVNWPIILAPQPNGLLTLLVCDKSFTLTPQYIYTGQHNISLNIFIYDWSAERWFLTFAECKLKVKLLNQITWLKEDAAFIGQKMSKVILDKLQQSYVNVCIGQLTVAFSLYQTTNNITEDVLATCLHK